MMTLRYLPRSEFERAGSAPGDSYALAKLFADMCRANAIYMIMRAGSGHIGTTFSSLDIVSWLHLHEVGAVVDPPEGSRHPIYFSSKGHDAPGLYAVLTAIGRLDFELIHALRQLGGLPGHPDVSIPGSVTNTGSLGMGISKAKGMVEAARLQGQRLPTFVLTGDGELQEGQIWESLQGAANRRLGEITVIVDHNKIQSDGWVSKVSNPGDLEAKFAAFGWDVARCDGHEPEALASILRRARSELDVPLVVIADTVKGKGVSFMEGIAEGEQLYGFHSGAPNIDVFNRAVDELLDRCDARLDELGLEPLRAELVGVPDRREPVGGHRLVSAYSRALCEQAELDNRIVVLDADLVLDCGLIPFAERFPDRFVECGIAEQDMVSQAGGMALEGLLPVVHSFACFLSARPAEQVYTNATERTKIVYVGSLAGLVPGGPGHSHQAVSDISRFGAVPGLVAVEPSHEDAVGPLLDLCLRGFPQSAYLRLVSVPVDVPFALPYPYVPTLGRGTTIREGGDGVILGAGPVLLSEAFAAAHALTADAGLDLRVVDLPWLNHLDADWLAAETDGTGLVVVLDNHFSKGGQGQMVLAALASIGARIPVMQRAVESVPVCGRNDEVLRFHRLDRRSLAQDILLVAEQSVR